MAVVQLMEEELRSHSIIENYCSSGCHGFQTMKLILQRQRGNVSRISANTPAAIVMFWNILPTSEETFGEGVDG